MDIKTPTFPESINEGTLAQWHKASGEFVRRDDVLADIETDKVVMEVLAQDNGTLTEILKREGDVVESDEIIGRFEPVAAVPVTSLAAQSNAKTDGAETESDGASPAARKLASESGIDIDDVLGSGRNGRVTKEDVARAVAKGVEEPNVEDPASRTVKVHAAPPIDTIRLANGSNGAYR